MGGMLQKQSNEGDTPKCPGLNRPHLHFIIATYFNSNTLLATFKELTKDNVEMYGFLTSSSIQSNKLEPVLF